MSFTLSAINRKKLAKSEDPRKYAVRHRNKWYSIDESEKLKIKIARVVGTLFFVGGLAERTAKNYYCNKLKTQLRADESAKQSVRFKNKAIKIREGAENRVQSEARHYKLTRVPAHKEYVANPAYFSPFSTRSPKIKYVYYTKKMNEPLSPTVKAALLRRAHLYR